MNDSNIQHKQTFAAPSGFGFDDDGQRVPVAMLDQPESESEPSERDEAKIRLEVFVRLISHLLRSDDQEQLWRAVQVLGFDLRLADGARNDVELAARLGVSRRQAHNIINELHRQNPCFADLFPGNSL